MSTEPTTRLILFGGATLEGDRGPISGRSAQRRRLALLAILALTRRGISRDKLVGYLWEESDIERARRLLSESLFVIRRSLGEDSILTTGDQLRLNPAVVWTDVGAFADVLQSGADEQAIALYNGPLLDGFFISEASEFEQWVDRERDRLAREYAAALARLAQRAEQKSEYAAAVSWWRKLCHHDPYAALPALGLMRALEAAGDRSRALTHARLHADGLREQLGADPDPQVEAFANELRAAPVPAPPDRIGPVASRAAAQVSIQATTKDTAPTVDPPKPDPPRPHILLRALAVSALAVATFLITWLVVDKRAPFDTKAARVTLVLLPNSQSAPELALNVADLLSLHLHGAGELRTVNPYLVLPRMSRKGTMSPADAAGVAQDFDAQLFAMIHVVPAGSRYIVTARLYDAGRPDDPITTAEARGVIDSLHVMVDSLSWQLLTASGPMPAERLRGVAAKTTRSWPALKAFFSGTHYFYAARYDSAVVAFEHAIEQDANFALAYYRLSTAAEWNFEFTKARQAAKSAESLADRLPVQYKLLIAPWKAFLDGNYQNAIDLYERILATDEENVEARAGLAEVLVHFNPIRGEPAAAASPMFDRVLEALPEFGEARHHALEFAARQNLNRFDSIMKGLAPQNRQRLAWDAVRAFTRGAEPGQQGVLDQLAKADNVTIGIAAGRLAAHTHNFRAAAEVARKLRPEDREWNAVKHLLLAQLALARDDWKMAHYELGRAETLEIDWTRELKALYLLHPLVVVPRDSLLAERNRLRAWRPGKEDASVSFFFGAHVPVHPELRLYLIGLLSADLGDTTVADSMSQLLARPSAERAPVPDAEDFGRALAQSLRAHTARARGQDSLALELLLRKDAAIQSPPEFLTLSPFYSRAHDRFVIASLAAKRGHTDLAIRWYSSLLDGYDFVYAAAAHQALARLYATKDPLRARHDSSFVRLTTPKVRS